MALTTVSDTVVLLDDEIHNMVWLMDYLSNSGITVIPTINANDAIAVLSEEIYRAAIIDLNVPILAPLEEAARAVGGVYAKFPGLFVARHARNSGYRARQIVIYSVHRDAQVSEEANKLGCTYILKGRPKEIKIELDAILEFDPTNVT